MRPLKAVKILGLSGRRPPGSGLEWVSCHEDLVKALPDWDVIRAGSRFYAYSTSSGTRRVPVAEAPSASGPYTKAASPLMTTGTFHGAVRGPGGADVLGDRIFFHGWVDGARWMYTATLDWADDLPVVRESTRG